MAKKEVSPLDGLLGEKKEVEEPVSDMVVILLDLAPCQGLGLMHSGFNYLHGGRYTVSQSVANDLLEMQRRGHSHEASITKSETAGRRRRNLDVNTPIQVRNPATGAMQMF